MGNSNHIIRALKPEETIRPQDIIFRSVTTADIPELKELFRNTVLTVNARDYTTEEVADWASCGGTLGETACNPAFHCCLQWARPHHRLYFHPKRRIPALYVHS